MALIVLPEGTQVSGSIGGTVYSHNRYGAYKRNRSVPVNPNTDRQVAIRNYVQNLTIRWHTVLTQDQRDAWDEYGSNVTWKNRLGQIVFMPGLNHYVRSNVPRLIKDAPLVDNAPTIFNLAASEQELTGSASEATQMLTIGNDVTAAWATETGGMQIYSMGLPQNSSIKFFGGPWRVIGWQNGQDSPNGEPVDPAVIPTAWPIAEGQRIWIRTRIGRADGRLSEFAQINFLCAA